VYGFIIVVIWAQHRCPMADDWIKKVWYIHTLEYYSVIEKNAIISFSGKWMEPEIIMLSK
jgi:hypothetical protein